MDRITIAATSGMRARMDSMDMLANNLANATTAGYKTDREFYSLFGKERGSGDNLPVVEKHWTDFSQGEMESNGDPLSFALSGTGFFEVTGPSGSLYTRSGAFQINSQGALTTPEGYAVHDASGQPIQMQPNQSFEVSTEGVAKQNGQEVGRIGVVDFADHTVMLKQKGSYFRVTDEKAKPQLAPGTQVLQGHREVSNVNTAEASIHLVGIMRQFEMLQKAIATTNEMNKHAVEEIARVGG